MTHPPVSRSIPWSDLQVILAVCRAGSLSGAGRLLGCSHSTVYRRLTTIEEHLGVRLFERLPSGYQMTEAGEATMYYAERIENEVHAFEMDLFGRDLQLDGKIRIGVGEGLAALVFPALLAEFRQINPSVSLDVVASVDNSDLARREVDVAVRATKEPPSAYVGRRIGTFEFAVYAAPDYLERAGPRDLKDYDWAVPYVVVDWLVPMIWKTPEEGYARCAFTSNSVLVSIEAAAAGLGVSLIAATFAERDPRLVRISDPLDHLTLQLWTLMHPDLRRNARVRALTKFLYERLGPQRSRFLTGSKTSEPPPGDDEV